MGSLTGCMKKAGKALSPANRSGVMSKAKAFRAEGAATNDVSRQAVQQQLAEVQALLAESRSKPRPDVQGTARQPADPTSPRTEPTPAEREKLLSEMGARNQAKIVENAQQIADKTGDTRLLAQERAKLAPTEPAAQAPAPVAAEAPASLPAEEVKPVASATHADPGKPAEPATAPVVAASIKKAAKSEDRKPSEMRAELLAKIDAALPAANSDADDERTLALARYEARMPTNEEARDYLVKRMEGKGTLDKAKAALQKERERSQQANAAAVAERIGFVTFDVPGDGEFKVVNTKARLEEFRKRVESSPGFKDSPRSGPPTQSAPASPGTVAAVTNMIDEGDYQAATDYAAVKGVNLDDMKLSKGDRAKLEAWQKANPQGATVADPVKETAPEVSQEAKPTAPVKAGAKIDDFGEELKGAKKMLYAARYADEMTAALALKTADHPMSKTWPAPDYAQLLADGADPWVVGFVHAARDEVKNKPSATWKLAGWVKELELLRDVTSRMMSGSISKDLIQTVLAKFPGLTNVRNRGELYEAVGHETSLKGVRLQEGSYFTLDGKSHNPPIIRWAVNQQSKGNSFSNWGRDLGIGATKAEAIADFKAKLEAKGPETTGSRIVKFEIYGRGGRLFIGKKIGGTVAEIKGGFDDAKSARAYLAEHQAELEKTLEDYKAVPNERKESNAPRVGQDHRNGADVTAEQFSEAFGFRGVQFGNYVEGTRRQQDLNDAYDALMDMAGVIGVPARALSLNGQLGLAFGARGGGNFAAAHYERGNVIINLTKTKGAGSLAHEWWHALDNYFSRMHGNPDEYLTEGTNKAVKSAVRLEMMRQFDAVSLAVRASGMTQRARKLDATRTKDYWTTGREMTARSFESYIINKLADQNAANDYLANVVAEEDFKREGAYPYLTAGEVPAVRAAFDSFFSTVETRETDAGTEMFSVTDGVDAGNPDADTATYVPDKNPQHKYIAERFQRVIAAGNPSFVLRAVEAPGDRPDLRSAAAIASGIAGHAVIFVHQPNGRVFNGSATTGVNASYVLIDVDSTQPVMAVLGHELLHRLRAVRPDLYDKLAERLALVLRNESAHAAGLRQRYVDNNVEAPTDAAVREELIADIFGDEWSDPAFWRELTQGQSNGFRAVIDAVLKHLDDLIAAITSKRPFGTDQYLTDLKAARAAVIEATREFSKGEVGEVTDGDIKLSIVDTVASIRNIDQTSARNLFLDAVTSHKGMNLWQRTVGTQYDKAQKNPDTFGKVFNAVQDYIKDISVFANAAADMAPSILPKLDNWTDLVKGGLLSRGAAKADLKAAGHAIFKGTLEDAKVYSASELKAMGLTPKQIGLYDEFRAAVDKSLDDMGKTELIRLAGKDGEAITPQILDAADIGEAASLLSQYLNEAAVDRGDKALTALAVTVGEKAAQVQKLKAEGYAPLMRFGRHTVTVTRGGEVAYFGMYESSFEANRAARELSVDPQFKGAKVTQGLMSEQSFKLFSGLNLDSLELFAKATGNADNPVYQEYLKLTKNNRSAMKRMIHRQGIAGFSEDTSRVLASFVTSNARMASGNLHLGAAKKAAEAIPKEQGDLKDEAVKLVDYAQNPQEEAAGMRALLFTNFIGGSVASALVNMTQSLTMTLPYLSQFGGAGKATGHLMAAARTAASGNAGGELGEALARAERDGIVSPQEIHHLQAEAMGRLGNHPLLKKAAFVWGSMFSLAEQFNRRVAFIAAYNVAVQQHIENPFAFAEKAVIETQGLYNKGNKPDWARGAIGATVMTFRQFSIHYLEFLTRMYQSGPEGKKAVAIALAILVLTAGAGGLPFADDLDDIIDTLAQAMGYDFSSKKAKRKFIAETLGLGDVGAELATRGLSSLPGMPIDLSLRMGMGNLLPGTGALLRSNTDRSRDVLEFAGAAGGLAKSAMDAGGKLLGGDVAGSAMTIAPLAIQNMLKAAQMWNTGEYRNKKDQKVMEADVVDGAMKFIGFQPSAIARESSRMGETQRSVQLVKNVESEIAAKWAQGLNDRDAEKVKEARADLAEWNADNPNSRIVITNSQIARRVMDMRASRADRAVKSAPKEIRNQVREGIN